MQGKLFPALTTMHQCFTLIPEEEILINTTKT